ncbi:MAG TPA: phosphoribosylglycinamide formyltransferase [Candidatus Brocadiia bacterium]|nr:phosphoribosylglycinamide formyltransferase [Candidatus Brocadiia bacterium]
MAGKKIRIVALLSGSGRTLQNLLNLQASGELQGDIVGVIGSLSGAYGLVRARNAGVPTCVIRKKDHPDVESFSAALTEQIQQWNPDLIVMAGFMCLYRMPPQFAGKVMNIHPALLPSFGGAGCYGHHVHEAVLAHGCKVSGCTVHFADNRYDCGPIIVQLTAPVREDDTPDSLAERVLEQEFKAYPLAINLFAQGRLRIEGRVVRILPK